MRDLGYKMIRAIVLTGLSDDEARKKQIVSNHRKQISRLDRAIEDYELLQIVRREVSQIATPRGGKQPLEKYHAKAANATGVGKDRIARSERIASILPPARLLIRQLGLENNETALTEIANAGTALDEQMAKARQLAETVKKPKTTRPKAKPELAEKKPDQANAVIETTRAVSRPDAMQEIPNFLRRNQDEPSYDQTVSQWTSISRLILDLSVSDGNRFAEEHLIPMIAALRERRQADVSDR
jgi:hypothetical protein